jgi:hypothetical protein
MEKENLINVNEFCINHNIEISFINSLQQIGLIEIVNINQTLFIENEQLRHLEKIVSFHFDLDINLEGIETVVHLLNRINSMQNEIILLKNKINVIDVFD